MPPPPMPPPAAPAGTAAAFAPRAPVGVCPNESAPMDGPSGALDIPPPPPPPAPPPPRLAGFNVGSLSFGRSGLPPSPAGMPPEAAPAAEGEPPAPDGEPLAPDGEPPDGASPEGEAVCGFEAVFCSALAGDTVGVAEFADCGPDSPGLGPPSFRDRLSSGPILRSSGPPTLIAPSGGGSSVMAFIMAAFL
ncbi:hypothetical protein BTO20_35800 [Mycobacterium dioxanotrophicus]|uniref:Uncharacterized protein n=1 Tax=Mycobacterium dioxanotrophicus TaxID=482462 RepID=A0A1Y0CDS6_9MYCO|nr:hypothetical protein BTO20_35800 [Mycobacterium dioxanotrophicus]